MFVHNVLLVALKVKPPIILDRSVFPYQDIRNTGGARPKVKREVKMAPGFCGRRFLCLLVLCLKLWMKVM